MSEFGISTANAAYAMARKALRAQVLTLRIEHGKSLRFIADRCGMTVREVKQMLDGDA